LEDHAAEVDDEIESSLKRFENEKIPIKGGYFWEFAPHFRLNSVISTILSVNNPHTTYVIISSQDRNYHLSARRSDKKEDMNILVKKLLEGLESSDGGGHVGAAGGHFLPKDKEEFKKRLGIV
ncbi:hypothetical protein KW787_04320, partial [Candidatus Pacearchaeota archaeon]|nr:hypothetical protein [Candidatus Pacearchaeota archaeon]